MLHATNKCVVVALGGNAISPPTETGDVASQFSHTRKSLRGLIDLFREDTGIAIVHGNGPQVGSALRRVELARSQLPDVPLGLLVAETEGSIGYMIEQSLLNLLAIEGIQRDVITIVTQVMVNRYDPGMLDPNKYIGRVFSRADAENLMLQEGWTIKPYRGDDQWRRVVGSPKPLSLVNEKIIREVVKSGAILIAAGGGGIPVYIDEHDNLEGLDAVIDKDLAASVIAKSIDADEFIILTNIDAVRLNFGKDNEKKLSRMTLKEAKQYYDQGHFGRGSMGPKIEASIEFLEAGGSRVVICELEEVQLALQEKAGTVIVTK